MVTPRRWTGAVTPRRYTASANSRGNLMAGSVAPFLPSDPSPYDGGGMLLETGDYLLTEDSFKLLAEAA